MVRRKRTSLLIRSENPSLSLYEPLLMVDQVPVFNMEQFLSVQTKRIRRIDVIEDVYVKGDLRFGGIINIQSREKDMAGIDLPANSFFIDYLAMHPPHQVQDVVVPGDRMPDTRNTMMWEQDFKVEKAKPSGISFVAPAYPGEYVVLFRGLDSKGELIVAATSFSVTK
ncbi:MAG: hypothetical protein KAR19_03940 [Bacteroidales bacterium]|nr:hypothetical protein [Bacteroidales bacterium]